MKKILTLLSIIAILATAAACEEKDLPKEPTETQQSEIEGYEIKYCVRKENLISALPIEGEMINGYYSLMAPKSLEVLISDAYSIITAKLVSVEQDESTYNLKYYNFEIEECIKGNADNLPSVQIEIFDYAFGKPSPFTDNNAKEYVAPYEIGARYFLCVGKYQYVYAKGEKIEYYLYMNAFSLLDGDNIVKLMQQIRPYEGTYPKDMDSFKEKVANIVGDIEENGKAKGCGFIESESIKEIANFAPIIIEVRKKGEADTEASSVTDIYEMELLKIHKGELKETVRIYADEENDLGEGEEFLLFLSEPQSESEYYYLASPEGSVISAEDIEKYNEAINFIYPKEEKTGFIELIKSFIKNIFG